MDGLKRVLKEAVVIQFKVLSQHYSGGTKENHKETEDCLCLGQI
jgi:hypothetical protein